MWVRYSCVLVAICIMCPRCPMDCDVFGHLDCDLFKRCDWAVESLIHKFLILLYGMMHSLQLFLFPSFFSDSVTK